MNLDKGEFTKIDLAIDTWNTVKIGGEFFAGMGTLLTLIIAGLNSGVLPYMHIESMPVPQEQVSVVVPLAIGIVGAVTAGFGKVEEDAWRNVREILGKLGTRDLGERKEDK